VLRNNDVRYGTWNVRSQYRAGLLMTVAKEVRFSESAGGHMGDLVRVQEVIWDTGGSKPAGEYTFFFLWKGE
jgi:hypothetical protein